MTIPVFPDDAQHQDAPIVMPHFDHTHQCEQCALEIMATHALVLRIASQIQQVADLVESVTPKQVEQINAMTNGPLGHLIKGMFK